MSSGINLRSQDQFLCSICLDVFTDPVSTPCGHNFCMTCITQHWTGNIPCKCPMCNEVFPSRPQLKINTFIREIVSQFKCEAQQEACSRSEQQAAKPGNVCRKHDKPLDLFCTNDQTCVCSLCSVLDHKYHVLVPLEDESKRKKAELRKIETEVQQMIKNTRLKIQETEHSVDDSKDDADRQKSEGDLIFTALKECAERGLEELIKEIEDKHKTAEKQAEYFIKDLQQQNSKLMKRSAEIKQLLKSEDHLHLLQSFSSLKAALPTKTWTEVRVHPPSYEGTLVRAVAQLEVKIREKMKKMKEDEIKRVQQYAVDVTLDAKTANRWLILSDDGKQVKHGDVWNNLPDNPERFSYAVCVLGQQSFSSGRFYFEVEVKGKTDWTLGVVRESVNRKGKIIANPGDGYWTVKLKDKNEYLANAAIPYPLYLHSGPEKVGVFVDYEEGLVSFYDVDAAVLIYSFTGCCFTEKLYPYFNPSLNQRGRNSSPLIICPLNDRW